MTVKDRIRGILPPGPRAGPRSPLALPSWAWRSALRRTAAEFNADNAWDLAAALTYYGVLSIFPGLLVLVSLVGLAKPGTINPLLNSLTSVAPGPARSILEETVDGLQRSSDRAGLVAGLGLLVGIWSASGYVAAFMRASNTIYDVPEGRPLWKTVPIRLGVTLATGVLLVISAAIVVLSGGVATAIGNGLGLESITITIWDIVKWPVLVILVSLMFGLLYWASPNAKQGGVRWVSPGGLVAVLLWLVASGLFGLYAANVSSFNATYGTLAGAVVFLVWLWLSNLALLFGAELDSELERQRAIAAGHPPDAEPYLRLRDDRRQAAP